MLPAVIAGADPRSPTLLGFAPVVASRHREARSDPFMPDFIPFIIKNRDKVEVSAQTDISHHNTVLKYTKQIGDTYYYVEEIRKRNKSLAFKSLIKREKENPSKERGQSVIAGGNILSAAPYVLIIHWFFIPCPRPTACKITTFP